MKCLVFEWNILVFSLVFGLVSTSCRKNSKADNLRHEYANAPYITYVPGTKINIESEIPVATVKNSKICSDISYYGADGEILTGARDCSQKTECRAEGQGRAVVESYTSCNGDGAIDCIANSTYTAALTTGIAPKIIAGHTVAGVAGSAKEESHNNCDKGGQIGCISTATYATMDLKSAGLDARLTANNFNETIASSADFEFWDRAGIRHSVSGDGDLSAANISKDIEIFGVKGGYPSATYPLSSNTDTEDLNLFITQLTTDGNFEFFDSTGKRYTGSGDSDILANNVRYGVEFENFSLVGTIYPVSCHELYLNGHTKNGQYTIDIDSQGGKLEPITVECEFFTSGPKTGGWTLVLNYLHQGGTTPSTKILSERLPIIKNNSLGTDEHQSPTSWGHAGNRLMDSLNFRKLRFNCRTSNHGRIIHMILTQGNAIAYVKTGKGAMKMPDPTINYLSDHTGSDSWSNSWLDKGDLALTNHPFFTPKRFHWNIDFGDRNRWECDDHSNNANQHTLHRVWIQ